MLVTCMCPPASCAPHVCGFGISGVVFNKERDVPPCLCDAIGLLSGQFLGQIQFFGYSETMAFNLGYCLQMQGASSTTIMVREESGGIEGSVASRAWDSEICGINLLAIWPSKSNQRKPSSA